ncbi:MAG: hypothetical protein JWM57_3757 [Phycisphaerales bacterium]|nr:hypothetical protein [Phycisphaerales bacterium]
MRGASLAGRGKHGYGSESVWTCAFKYSLLIFQTLWMLAILPGHVRGMVVVGSDCASCSPASREPACCATKSKPLKPGETPSQERKERCAVCYQAHGYTVPPVYDFDLVPTGLCELRRLIEPSKRHQLLCAPTYFANGPPATPLPA